MAEYIVSIDNEEGNPQANALSITGRVNGTSCARVIRLSDVAGLSKKAAKLTKQRALVAAFLEKPEELAAAGGDRVDL